MCTACHAALAAPEAALRHAHHDPADEGGRCLSCHMPRIVYGVLDVHRSHRIELPDPAGAAAAGRPDACTGCHVERTAAWAEDAARRWWGEAHFPAGAVAPPGTAPFEALFGGAPVARAVAADALGRAPADAPGRARHAGALLDVMSEDRYPAVRHLAWRSLRRLIVPDAPPGSGVAADYDPSADAVEPAASWRACGRPWAARRSPRRPPWSRSGGGPPTATWKSENERRMNARSPTHGGAQLCRDTSATRVRAPNVLRSPAASRR